ncbi:MAG TPA: flagellar basal-body rod protein FlgG [Xanthobacteraceae bacterium]|jgi:flagellar basal-body rod protein FlgG|nr:flagellar basal-body rod protein FlgG [Xanthobacteraceae bacterium]
MRALYTAATGMAAQELNVQVISNNIANMRTTGFKRQRAEFQDLMYQNLRRVGSNTSAQGTKLPIGLDIGAGVKTSGTPRIMVQGSLLPTDRELDVAIRGEGFFRVLMPDSRTAYSRAGSFEMDDQGRLVTPEGYLVDPAITFPQNASNISINQQGEVSALLPGQTTSTVLGQLQLARFMNKSGLEAIGDNLFLETAASGTPQVGNPSVDGMGNLLQSQLEQANVSAVTEMSDLITAQRAYAMNAKVVTAADDMLQQTANMMR